MSEFEGDTNRAEEEFEEDGEGDILNNVIPMKQLKNGWYTLSSMVMLGTARMQEKIIETYNSEQVQNLKQKVISYIIFSINILSLFDVM